MIRQFGNGPEKQDPEESDGASQNVLLRGFHQFRSFLARGRFSSVTRRIVVFNVVALFVLVGGILYLNQFREGLIDARRQSLLTQAAIIAGAIAQSATATGETQPMGPVMPPHFETDAETANNDLPIIPENAAPILRRLVVPTQTRARLYDDDGWLILDSRQLNTAGQIISFALPPPEDNQPLSALARARDAVMRLLPGRDLPRLREAGSQNGRIFEEVQGALRGIPSSMERVNDRGELIVSVAVPIQRYRAVLGVLMLSTRGGDIDAIVRAERLGIVQVFLVALGVSILLSVVLAGTIAEPLRRLAESAEVIRRGKLVRAQIPDFTERHDEIGDLSSALREMTDALYSRIEAIESFAADVAHELKNPLTSLRSAVETLDRAKDENAKQRLMQIVQNDVRRIDRLISDISNASRLDAELAREEMENVNISTLLETVCDLFVVMDNAQGPRVKLEIDAPPELLVVRGHDTRLGQVVRNLIDNAVSFSPADGVVRVEALRRGQNVLIIVEDEGPGIQSENLERIFDRFHTDRPDSFGEHSGLGLAISKQIVEAHSGQVWAENRKDRSGARFTVALPAA